MSKEPELHPSHRYMLEERPTGTKPTPRKDAPKRACEGQKEGKAFNKKARQIIIFQNQIDKVTQVPTGHFRGKMEERRNRNESDSFTSCLDLAIALLLKCPQTLFSTQVSLDLSGTFSTWSHHVDIQRQDTTEMLCCCYCVCNGLCILHVSLQGIFQLGCQRTTQDTG